MQVTALEAMVHAEKRARTDMAVATAAWERRWQEHATEVSGAIARASAADEALRLGRSAHEQTQHQMITMSAEVTQLREKDVASLRELGTLRVALAERVASEHAMSVELTEARAARDACVRGRDDALARVAAMREAVVRPDTAQALTAGQRELVLAQHRANDADAAAADLRGRVAALGEQLRTQSIVVR